MRHFYYLLYFFFRFCSFVNQHYWFWQPSFRRSPTAVAKKWQWHTEMAYFFITNLELLELVRDRIYPEWISRNNGFFKGKLNKAFLHFLPNCCPVWWFLKVLQHLWWIPLLKNHQKWQPKLAKYEEKPCSSCIEPITQPLPKQKTQLFKTQVHYYLLVT